MEPITLQNSDPNLLNVVLLPHMPERWGAFFDLPSPRIKLSLLELELGQSFQSVFTKIFLIF